jgi:Ni/Co efflux regulator RcnB
MKWTTLITALLIGSAGMSTVAAAQPSNGPEVYDRHRRMDRGDRDDYRDRDRDHDRRTDEGGRWDSGRSWFPPIQMPNGGSYDYNPYGTAYGVPQPAFTQTGFQPLVGPIANFSDRANIHLGAQAGRFRALKLDVMRGNVFVQQVAVEFLNGQTQVIQVGRWMNDRGEPVVIDLQGRRGINRVIVYTDGRARAAYELSGL